MSHQLVTEVKYVLTRSKIDTPFTFHRDMHIIIARYQGSIQMKKPAITIHSCESISCMVICYGGCMKG